MPDTKAKVAKKKDTPGKKIGAVTHYFNNIGVAVVKLTAALKSGDEIVIAGRGQEVVQKVASMQIEHDKVDKAAKGKSIGLKVKDSVKEGDIVYKK
ncbi:hypothetical protein CL634_10415 [bacterium]|nr:hypothetical protein [bacterium]|tara:strand:- start:1301 stop:1588 length:288 start_codon:yes stop_codon:yes gene_type:complete